MERKKFEGRTSRRPRKPQSWARTRENGNIRHSSRLRLGTAAGRFSQDQRSVSILRKPSVARSAATAINIIQRTKSADDSLVVATKRPSKTRRNRFHCGIASEIVLDRTMSSTWISFMIAFKETRRYSCLPYFRYF